MNEQDLSRFSLMLGIRHPIYYSISGAHLYGWASPDSDLDVRGCHVNLLKGVIGLNKDRDVVEYSDKNSQPELDFVSFDIEKELQLVLANNCNVLENIMASPVLVSEPYWTLRALANASISKRIAKPYYGLAESNYQKFIKGKDTVSTKKYLYVIRALLAGINVLQTRNIMPNIQALKMYLDTPDQMLVDELIEWKTKNPEKNEAKANTRADELIQKLRDLFKATEAISPLLDKPEPRVEEQVNDFLIQMRLDAK